MEQAIGTGRATAVLTGPSRSGKSLLARWFADSGKGEAIDDVA